MTPEGAVGVLVRSGGWPRSGSAEQLAYRSKQAVGGEAGLRLASGWDAVAITLTHRCRGFLSGPAGRRAAR